MNALRLSLVCLLLSACGGSDGPDDPKPTPNTPTSEQPGTVYGTAVDTQGRPLADVKVWVEPELTTGMVQTRTDASGTYRVPDLPGVPYSVRAFHEVDFEGRRYCLRLAMPSLSDYDSFSAKSAAVKRDFVWKLTGPVPEFTPEMEAFWGGNLSLVPEGRVSGTTVEVTLTPTTPLVDGSTGAPITRTFQPTHDGDNLKLNDVPLARYRVTGRITHAGGTQPLHFGKDTSGTWADQPESASFVFPPSSGGCTYSNGMTTEWLFVHSPLTFD